MQQNLPNDFREAGLVFFPHLEEFQASSPQLGCRAAAAGGRVNRAGVGADGLCCLLGPDSGQLCPSRGLQLGEGCGDGRRPSPGSEPDRASAGARERRALLSPGASRGRKSSRARRRYGLSRQLARRGRVPCRGPGRGLSSSAPLDCSCCPLRPVLSVTASAGFLGKLFFPKNLQFPLLPLSKPARLGVSFRSDSSYQSLP